MSKKVINQVPTNSGIKIMALDCSSSTIGLSILEKDLSGKIKLLHVEHYKPLKKGTIFERLSKIKEYIISKLEEFNPNEVAIEEFLQFMKGISGAKTIIILALINRTIGLTVYEWIGKPPCMLNVNSIRAIIKPKGYKGKLKKEAVPEILEQRLGIKFEYLYNKKGNITVESYDRSDSIAVGLAYFLRSS